MTSDNRRTRFREWLWAAPSSSLPWWQQCLQALLRILIIFFRESYRDALALRASALTFTVILSLVPMLALGTAVLKGLGAGGQVKLAAHRLVDRLETSSEPILFEAEVEDDAVTMQSAPAYAKAKEAERRSLTVHLRRAIDQVFGYVDRTNFAALGILGIIGLFLTLIVVLDSIESSMNAIWQAPAERPLGRKIMNYLAFVVLMPLAINLSLAAETLLESETLRHAIEAYLPITGLTEFTLSLMPLVLLVSSFTLLYRYLPNTRVKTLAALAGGVFGAALWLLVLSLYVNLQVGVTRYNAIYGSFATLPLFLLWVQLCWVIFLAGAEMAFAVQNWAGYRPESRPLTPVNRLALAYSIIAMAHNDLTNRRVTEPPALAAQLGEPETVVLEIVEMLEKAGILRRTAEEEQQYVLGAPADKLNPVEIVDLVFGTEVPPMRGSSLAIEALQAGREAVKNKKIVGG